MREFMLTPRVITASTLTGLFLASMQGCSPDDALASPQERIDASYSQAFIDLEDTACYEGVINHDSVHSDLLDELNQRPWLDVDSMSGAYDAASNIDTILEAIHELGGARESDDGTFPVQTGDVYQFCVNQGAIQAGQPEEYTASNG